VNPSLDHLHRVDTCERSGHNPVSSSSMGWIGENSIPSPLIAVIVDVVAVDGEKKRESKMSIIVELQLTMTLRSSYRSGMSRREKIGVFFLCK
jgi:hypothetical protein